MASPSSLSSRRMPLQHAAPSASAAATAATIAAAAAAASTCIRFPSTGDTVYRGTDCMIVWQYSASDASSAPPAVDIELQRAKDGRPVRTIAQRVRNQGSFFWSIGPNVPVGGPFRLFVGNMFMSTPYGCDAMHHTEANGPNTVYSGAFTISRDLQEAPTYHRDAAGADSLSLSDALASMSLEDDECGNGGRGCVFGERPASAFERHARRRPPPPTMATPRRMVVTTSEDDGDDVGRDDDGGNDNSSIAAGSRRGKVALATAAAARCASARAGFFPATVATGVRDGGDVESANDATRMRANARRAALPSHRQQQVQPTVATVRERALPPGRQRTATSAAAAAAAATAAAAAAAATRASGKALSLHRAQTTSSTMPPPPPPSGASSFALDASGSGGGGYTASGTNALSDTDNEQLCAYIYSRVQMAPSVVRRSLKDIVRDDDIRPGTVLSTGMRAGQFCIYYLLVHYYKRHLKRSNADLERRIAQENYRFDDLRPELADVLRVPTAYRGGAAGSSGGGGGVGRTMSVVPSLSSSSSSLTRASSRAQYHIACADGGDADTVPVLFGGTLPTGSGSGSNETTSRDELSVSGSNSVTTSRKEMSACVDGITIRQEREYLQRIRCWSLNVDQATLVDVGRGTTAEQFAVQYVQTDRRKRILNTQRSKDKRKQRECERAAPRATRARCASAADDMDCDEDNDGGGGGGGGDDADDDDDDGDDGDEDDDDDGDNGGGNGDDGDDDRGAGPRVRATMQSSVRGVRSARGRAAGAPRRSARRAPS